MISLLIRHWQFKSSKISKKLKAQLKTNDSVAFAYTSSTVTVKKKKRREKHEKLNKIIKLSTRRGRQVHKSAARRVKMIRTPPLLPMVTQGAALFSFFFFFSNSPSLQLCYRVVGAGIMKGSDSMPPGVQKALLNTLELRGEHITKICNHIY